MPLPRAGIFVLALWGGVVATGFAALNVKAGEPGMAALAPAHFPADVGFTQTSGRAILVMVAHPRCPCTRASLNELDRLMSRTKGRVDAFVVFSPVVPGDHGELRTIAARIEGVRSVDDRNGAIAKRFGAMTSGQVFVYGTDGDLQFAGGITAARGHEGDNGGADAALRAALGERRRSVASVFGCGLFAWEDRR